MICCVTGHRPKGFPFPRDNDNLFYMKYCITLYDKVKELIFEGVDCFISGMAEGVDIDFANIVLLLRNEDYNITLEAALPYPPRPHKIITEYIEDFECILTMCNKKTIVSNNYYKGCMQKRNEYMVDKADIVLAVWNGKKEGGTWNTIKYALSKNKPISYIMLNEIKPILY